MSGPDTVADTPALDPVATDVEVAERPDLQIDGYGSIRVMFDDEGNLIITQSGDCIVVESFKIRRFVNGIRTLCKGMRDRKS